jgi:hypothetical protein
MRNEVGNHAVDRRAGRDHDQNPPGPLEGGHQFLRRVNAGDGAAARRAVEERPRPGGIQIVSGDWKASALDVARQIRAHHPKPDHAHLAGHSD